MTQLLHQTRVLPSLADTLVEVSAGRLFAVYWGALALVDLTRGSGVVALVAVSVLVAVLAVRQRPAVAVALAAVGWLFVTGFVVNAHGLLRVSGPGDGVRLGLLVAVALVTARASRPHPAVPPRTRPRTRPRAHAPAPGAR